MNRSPNAFSEKASPQLVAPLWHTAVVVIVLLGFSALGALWHSAFGVRRHGHISGYLTATGFEWGMLAFLWFGLRLRGNRLIDLLGGRWLRWSGFFKDMGLALAFLIVSNVILGVLAHLLKATPNSTVRGILPQGTAEILVFLFLAFTAGICEEMIFRGYLQRQFSVLSRSAAAGVAIQGIIFGAAHGYQGPKYMAMICVYGCLFGTMAHWRRSLLPGMIAHFLQDGVLGSVLGHAMKRTVLLGFPLG